MYGILRIIGGGDTGSTFVLGERVRIGRAPDVDIQLAEPEVSRHHARIVRTPEGRFELTDLGSKAGTLVQGKPVSRHLLRPYETISIGGGRFVFEEVATVGEDAACFARKVRGFGALRPTLVLEAVSPAAEKERPQARAAPQGRPPTRRQIPRVPESAPGVRREIPKSEAAGRAASVLRDILDYRRLLLQQLRGEALDTASRSRLDVLSARLMVDTLGLPASRRFHRSPCSLSATLTQRDGSGSRTLPIQLEDLSAGGARVALHDAGVRTGDEVWLAFDLAKLFSRGHKVVFRSRVVWTKTTLGATGLMFGGNAQFVESVDAVFARA